MRKFNIILLKILNIKNTVPILPIKMRKQDNGLDLGPPGTKSPIGPLLPKYPDVKNIVTALAKASKRKMSHDWARYISENVKSVIDSAKLEEKLHEVNMTDSMRAVDIISSMRSHMAALRNWEHNLPELYDNRSSQEFYEWANKSYTNTTYLAAYNRYIVPYEDNIKSFSLL
jgi:hypothetical protein